MVYVFSPSRVQISNTFFFPNAVTQKRPDRTTLILRLTSFQNFYFLDLPTGYWLIWIFWLVSFFCALGFGDNWFSAQLKFEACLVFSCVRGKL